MDSKALAKSKRAHSLHHAKKPQRGRAPTPTATNQKPRLPSNWDRYDDGDEDELDASVKRGDQEDAVLPKSKGADYRHLIDEARSSNQQQVASFDDELFLSSLGDIFPGEFNERMIKVKGERVAAWIEDDNFVVEDGASASGYEASLFSLNLHALSERLEKVDISERLFIEADLVATDMVTTQEANSGEVGEYGKMEMPSLVEELNKISHTTDAFLSGSSPGGYKKFEPVDQGLTTTSQVRDDSSSSQHSTSSQRIPSFDVTAEEGSNMPAIGLSRVDSQSGTSNCKSKSSYFEVSASEAELDMLLDSFNVANIHGYSGNDINRTSEVESSADGYLKHVLADKGSDVGSQARVGSDSNEDSRAFKHTATNFHVPGSTGCDVVPKTYSATSEDELDMLLNSAIDLNDLRFDTVSDILKESPKPVAKFTREVSGSQIATGTGNLDDILDDLLEETSKTMNQNSLYQAETINSAITEQPSSSRALSKPEALDDFDSWMDTL